MRFVLYLHLSSRVLCRLSREQLDGEVQGVITSGYHELDAREVKARVACMVRSSHPLLRRTTTPLPPPQLLSIVSLAALFLFSWLALRES